MDQVIPLAFHVDYWDYLGWPDRFAQKTFTQRQRFLASLGGSRTVYTPQLVLQGGDLRNQSGFRTTVSRINSTKARADIRVQVVPQVTALAVHADVTVTDTTLRPHAVAYVALYENNLSSDVTAGENEGHTLQHDYVVRRWLGPLVPDPQGTLHINEQFSFKPSWKGPDLGVVVCVMHRRTGDVLQAVALPLHSDTPASEHGAR